MSEPNTLEPPNEDEKREIDAILDNFGGIDSIPRIYEIVNSQLNVIHARAQSLLSLASVVVTVTGFSGRIIADTNRYSQGFIIVGVAMVAAAAVITLLRVMPIRWVTSYMHLGAHDWLLTALRRRTKKSCALRVALWFMVVGMVCYLIAMAIMLSHPEAAELRRMR